MTLSFDLPAHWTTSRQSEFTPTYPQIPNPPVEKSYIRMLFSWKLRVKSKKGYVCIANSRISSGVPYATTETLPIELLR